MNRRLSIGSSLKDQYHCSDKQRSNNYKQYKRIVTKPLHNSFFHNICVRVEINQRYTHQSIDQSIQNPTIQQPQRTKMEEEEGGGGRKEGG
jgi:hypothetical protein